MIDRYTLPKMGAIWGEKNKFKKWLEVELAACEAWHKLGKIPLGALKKIKSKASFDLARINAIEKEVQHDVIAFLSSVAEKVGSSSRYIHMGLTSSDVVDTAQSLLMCEAANIIIEDVKNLISILRARAKEFKNTPMIGRTHGVHAEPMTFGLKLALWLTEMERNLKRLEGAKNTISVGKISGAVGTYANIDPHIEEAICRKVGLKAAPISNQVLQRDRHAEFSTVLAIVAASIEKFATEIRGLQRTEIGEVEEPFGKGQKGSSAMPHKKNPVLCERMVGMARLLRGNAMVALENVALWHERDISHSSAERIIIPDSCIILDYMLQTFTRIVKNMTVYPENMLENLEKSQGLIFSQRVLLELVNKGLTREEAYKLTQAAAMKARERKKNLKDIVAGDFKIRKHLKPKEIDQCFDINYYLRNVNAIFKRLNIK